MRVADGLPLAQTEPGHEARARVRFQDPRIEMAHGAGGTASRRLIEGLVVPLAGVSTHAPLADAAYLDIAGTALAFTADSFVVRPLRFNGGSIGELAVYGTMNDLAVSGARPMALLTTLVIEAGLSTQVLEAELRALGEAAARHGVAIVGGDTKVVERGKADGLYITTAGIGRLDSRLTVAASRVQAGDRVLVSGPIGDHGITILLARGDIDLRADLQSDTRSVWPFVEAMAEAAGSAVHWMRDPTRGGVATALNELVRDRGLSIALDEDAVPVRDEVRGACELLGLDPLHIANEGQVLAVVAAAAADAALAAMQAVPGGEQAAIIGQVREERLRTVTVVSAYGGTRIIDMLVGDPLPRIC
ncbi:MAG TPA: hydrogenase expression/formation protein HypE [Vicinamibacterales bacterium]|jgi:hydrogenase expression/formation protein HypE